MNSTSRLFKLLRAAIGRSPIFAFNLIYRDRWVAAQAAALPRGSRVLDVGAGSCPYRPLFAHCEYRSQDFSGLLDDQLRHGSYGKIDYVSDAGNIPVEGGTFDAVICTEMLEHVMNPLVVVREIARVLRPGGKLLLTAPLGSGIHQEPYHYYGGFTPYWYERCLAESGFEEIKVEANAGSFKFFSQESLRFLRTTRPFIDIPWRPSIPWAPVWLCILPVLAIAIPVAAHLLDQFDNDKRFTIGYHVTAVRS